MKSFKQFNEVAPPGWGHTKAEKEKTKPDKPKSKIGGTAAAFKRALDRGDFKGLPGDKTYKDKKASMFKLMWAMKKKGDKPHYKPGTDEKYKKYQKEDWKPEIEVIDTKKRKKDAEKKRKEAESSLPPHLRLDAMKKAFAHTNESLGFTIDSGEHKKASKKAKIRNLAKGNTNPNEKAAAEKKAGGPRLIGELNVRDAKKLAKASVLSTSDNPKDQDRARARQVEIDYKDLMDQRKKKKVGVGKSMREEKKSCPEGEYYCFDMGKCRPIPKGHKVREDGELVKEATTMRDNNLFGNAYAGSAKLKREKKKAIENIPHKSSETYKRNLQNKTPIDPRESVEIHDARGNLAAEVIDIIKPQPMNVPDSPVKWKELTEAQLPKRNGSIIDCYLGWRGKNYMIKMFFPQSRTRKPTKEEVNSQLQKVYPGAKLWDYQVSDYEPGAPLLQVD